MTTRKGDRVHVTLTINVGGAGLGTSRDVAEMVTDLVRQAGESSDPSFSASLVSWTHAPTDGSERGK